jgi:citrate synthase
MIRRALVLLADHELNASTFAVRVAASTGASLAAAILAGFAALSGPRHGGAAMGVRAMLADAKRDGASAAVTQRLAEGRGLPGFGHPLYPQGDPRATALLAHLTVSPGTAALRRAAKAATGLLPNVDFALVALTETMDAPTDAAFGLFAVGRTAGWIAHALEQARTNALIRPRARYVGPPPEL